jgi:hypothetical protein
MRLFLNKLLIQIYHRQWDNRRGANNDSSQGMPLWAFILTALLLFYIVIRVWIAIKKDDEK